MDIIFELFEKMPRQGPGTDESTLRAYSVLQNLPPEPRILDVGCGSGKQSLALARAGKGTITAVDVYLPFLKDLRHSATNTGDANRFVPICASMDRLPFSEGSFDLIWSEGAIYIIGFEEGLRKWAPILAPGGSIVVSELSWLKEGAPGELVTYWEGAYPGISSIQENIAMSQRCGYRLRGFFTLPEEGWRTEFYHHLEHRLSSLRTKYADNAEALAVLADEQTQISLHSRFSEWYGYVFYILEKPG